ncbi:hypothetical protein [Chitinophaga sp. MM2321]|uniref:hypothetical protein n=1 Tax=Chitinophaga sp. MM2321 TaxID=3137178 RepID=UPI0032D5A5FE
MNFKDLLIGWAMEDITPLGPAVLFGQYYDRLAQYIESPLTATACAFERVAENGVKEQAIMVSVDLIWCTALLKTRLKERIKLILADFDVNNLVVNATHTHSAPEPDVTGDYGKMVVEKLADVIAAAWKNRKPATIGSSAGYAVVGHNRRIRYADGSAEMYGSLNRPDFIGIEGTADSAADMIFCWDEAEQLTGIIMNVPCPAQVTEAKYFVSADYWSEVRKQLKQYFNRDVYVLAQCGAAGDISPRDLTRPYATDKPDMWDVPGIVAIGESLLQLVKEAYPEAKKRRQIKPVFKHLVKQIDIPFRKVSEAEYNNALVIVKKIRAREPADPGSPLTAFNRFLSEVKENEKLKQYGPWDNKDSDYGILRLAEIITAQYSHQQKHPYYHMELHVIRLDDVVFASNSFELFVDYGFMIKGRSKAAQTFIVQLSDDYAGYLPTQRALEGGGYSATANPVGPDGGRILVEETISAINSLF